MLLIPTSCDVNGSRSNPFCHHVTNCWSRVPGASSVKGQDAAFQVLGLCHAALPEHTKPDFRRMCNPWDAPSIAFVGKHVQPQHAAACRSTKNFALSMAIHHCLSALFLLFALETFCLTYVSSVLYYPPPLV